MISQSTANNFADGIFFDYIDEIHKVAVKSFEKSYDTNIEKYCTSIIWKNFNIVEEREWICGDSTYSIILFDLKKSYQGISIKPLKRDFFIQHEESFRETFLSAMNLLNRFEKQDALIKTFVKNIHPIYASGEGHDTSHSDPSLPFSIFTSFPLPHEANISLRLLESVYHEALHLLLTTMEHQFPLSDSSENETATIYSPWKKENRRLQGIIHGAFVFKNLFNLFEQILDCSVDLSPFDKSYLIKRCNTISNELEMTKSALNNPYITDFGRQLFARLIK